MGMDLVNTMHIAASGMKGGVGPAEDRLPRTSPTPSRPARPAARPPIAARPSASAATSTRRAAPSWCRPGKVGVDKSDFQTKYEPSNPNADSKGYVQVS
ncbi:MAG: hypothetical protein WDN72_03985 [Alphaproteobacteria bacterium]